MSLLYGNLQQEMNFPSTTNMVAYYRMENANDSFGTNNGTATNMVFNISGMKGNAGEWANNNRRIDVPSSDTLKIGSGYTISLWCYIYNFSGSTNAVDFLIAKGTFPYNYRIHTEGSKYFTFYAHLNGTARYISSTNNVINKWYNIIARLNPVSGNTTSGMSLFTNGVISQNTSYIGYPSVTDAGLGIGNLYGANTYTTSGLIDEVAIWKRVLSDEECLNIYNNGIGTYLA